MALVEVQSVAKGSAEAVASLTATLSSTPVKGNLLVAKVDSGATVTMTSSGWTLAKEQVNGIGLYCWYKIAGESESKEVKVTPSVSESTEIEVTEYNPSLGGVPTLDKTAGANSSNGATSLSSGETALITKANSLAVAIWGWQLSPTSVTSYSANFLEHAAPIEGKGAIATFLATATLYTTTAAKQICTATLPTGGQVPSGLICVFYEKIEGTPKFFPPQVRTTGSVVSGVGTVTPGVPTGTIRGDLMVMVGDSGGATANTEANTALTASGWTAVPNVEAQKKGNTRLTLLYRISTGEDATTTNDTGDHQQVKIIVFKAGTFDPVEPFNSGAGGTQSSTKAVSIPGPTTTRDNCLVLACASGDLPDASSTTEFGVASSPDLVGVTERIDNTTTAGDGGAINANTGVMEFQGPVAPTTLTAVTAADRGVMSVAINPYTSGPVIRGVSTAFATGTAAVSPVVPTGTVAGDLLIMFAESGGATAEAEANTELTASGWTKVKSVKKGNTRCTVLWRIATGGDATTTNDTGDHQGAKIVAIVKGTYDEATPINVSEEGTQAATKAVSIPGATSTRANCLVLAFVSGNLPDASSTTEFSAAANAELEFAEIISNNAFTTGDGMALGAIAGIKKTAGAYGATTTTAATEAERGLVSLAVNSISTGTTVTLTPATETDAAQASAYKKRVTVGQATETDAAVARVFIHKFPALTPATETDVAQSAVARKRPSLTPAAETDAAQARSFLKRLALVPATELDTAQVVAIRKRLVLTPATEADAAQARAILKRKTLTPATETDAALTRALLKRVALVPALETDDARPLTLIFVVVPFEEHAGWETRDAVLIAWRTDAVIFRVASGESEIEVPLDVDAVVETPSSEVATERPLTDAIEELVKGEALIDSPVTEVSEP